MPEFNILMITSKASTTSLAVSHYRQTDICYFQAIDTDFPTVTLQMSFDEERERENE